MRAIFARYKRIIDEAVLSISRLTSINSHAKTFNLWKDNLGLVPDAQRAHDKNVETPRYGIVRISLRNQVVHFATE